MAAGPDEVRGTGPLHGSELCALTTPRVFLIPDRPVCITSSSPLPELIVLVRLRLPDDQATAEGWV
jgi:hypothetical protein